MKFFPTFLKKIFYKVFTKILCENVYDCFMQLLQRHFKIFQIFIQKEKYVQFFGKSLHILFSLFVKKNNQLLREFFKIISFEFSYFLPDMFHSVP